MAALVGEHAQNGSGAADWGGVGSLVGPRGAVTLTAEEQLNVETVLAYRRADFVDRKAYLTRDFRVHRRGMAHHAESAAATGGAAYTAHSLSGRVDTMQDLVAKGDRVWGLWVLEGTHSGELFGIPASDRPLEVLELGIWRLEGGRIAEAWFMADEWALAAQLAGAGSGPAGRSR